MTHFIKNVMTKISKTNVTKQHSLPLALLLLTLLSSLVLVITSFITKNILTSLMYVLFQDSPTLPEKYTILNTTHIVNTLFIIIPICLAGWIAFSFYQKKKHYKLLTMTLISFIIVGLSHTLLFQPIANQTTQYHSVVTCENIKQTQQELSERCTRLLESNSSKSVAQQLSTTINQSFVAYQTTAFLYHLIGLALCFQLVLWIYYDGELVIIRKD